jgi:two-component system LytT family response regulator
MKVVIIEDETLAAQNLISYLDEIGDIKVLAVLESVRDSVEWLQDHKHPDLVFMDIHLADGSSFEIFNHVEIHCPIIFTTAYDEYAVKAFKVNSIDYLLKPFDLEDVEQALEKFQKLKKPSSSSDELQKLLETLKPEKKYRSHFLVLQEGDKLVPLAAPDIACIYIDSGVVSAITKEGKRMPLDHTLDEMEALLDPNEFFRANRQYIIARNSIKEAILWFNNRLAIKLDVKTPDDIIISKARVPEFKSWFMDH